MSERDPFDDRLERQLVTAAERRARGRPARRRDGARARIAIGATSAVALLGSLTLVLVLVDGGADPAPPAAASAGACAPFALNEQLRITRATPPAIVVAAAPSLSAQARASGAHGGGEGADGLPRSAHAADPFCPAPLDVGAVVDPRLVARLAAARGGGAAYLSALRGPARSGVVPASGVDVGDRSWKVCLSLAAARRPDPVAIACQEPDRVLDHGLVLRHRSGDRTQYVFYVAADARRLRLRYADGGSGTLPLRDGVATLVQAGDASAPAQSPTSYTPLLADGTPVDGGDQIDYTR